MIKFLLTSVIVLFVATFNAQITINEASNANSTSLIRPDGSNPDWIELHNASATSINLQGYQLTDDSSKVDKWTFPSVTIAPNGFLTVFATGTTNAVSINHYETVVSPNQTWKYYIPVATYNPGWKGLGFNDVAWNSGNLGIGYGDGDDATTIATGTTTVYVRKTFNVTDVLAIKQLVLDIDYDDGFVAYLNGVEIARAGLTSNPVAWDDLSTDHEAQVYQGQGFSTFMVNETALQNVIQLGTNVLAIEVHNSSTTSSDLSLIPYLTLGFDNSTVYYNGTTHPAFNLGSNGTNIETNFSIKTSGEQLFLFNPAGLLIDTLFVSDLNPDMSVGKQNDGVASWKLFQTATPNASNNTSPSFAGFEQTPTITIDGGFITTATSVTIQNNSTSGGQLRYTLNGSTPTITSPLVTGPINISSSKVLKVICFPIIANLLPSEIATETYLYNENFTLPVISISTDPANLYGANGIFDNYNTDWKKACVIEYFDKNKVKQFETKASIKPDGGAGGSRSNPQHSVTIEPANKLFGTGDPIHYPLIEEKSYIQKFDAFYLRNGSNFWNTYPQKDATFMRIMRQTNANSQAYTPVIAFVNGQYFGVYELREKANEGYFETNYGNNPDCLDLLSVSYFYGAGVLRTVEGSDTGFYNMKDFVTQYNPTNSDYYKRCDQKLDLKNFTDYLSAENWFANVDWIYNNMKIARTRTTDNKWRFFLQDMELGLGGWTDYNSNIFDYFRYNNQPNPYWQLYDGLIQNTTFKNNFVNRYADLMNTVFKPSYFMPILDTMYQQLIPEMPRHFQKWTNDVTGGMATYTNYRTTLINNLYPRNNVVRSQIVSEFNLVKQVNVTLNVQPANAGYIKISTIVPETLPWTGVYFDGVPVQITAVANPGFTFSNWQNNNIIPAGDLDSNSIELNIPSNSTYVAIFEGETEPLKLAISEIHYNPDPTINGGNWIELHNYGSTPLNLTNWSVKSNNHYDKFQFPNQTIIPVNGYLVVCEDTSLFKLQYPTVMNYVGGTGFTWNNKEDSIFIFNGKEKLALTYYYADDYPFPHCADGFGRTLENSKSATNQTDASIWFCGCIGGSPGKAYSPCNEKLVFNEINYNSVFALNNAGDWFEVKNTSSLPVSLNGFTFKDQKDNHVFNLPAITLGPSEIWVFTNDSIRFNSRYGITNISGNFNFGLSNNEALRLFDASGKLVASVVYNSMNPWPSSPMNDDYTLEYNKSLNNQALPEAWFAGCQGGSPGVDFSPCPVLPEGQNLYLYPNPTSNSLTVVFNNATNSSNITTIQFIDLQGKLVQTYEIDTYYSKLGTKFDVSSFANGYYFVRILQDGLMDQKPFVKY